MKTQGLSLAACTLFAAGCSERVVAAPSAGAASAGAIPPAAAPAQEAGDARSFTVGGRRVALRVQPDLVGLVFDETADDASTAPLVPLLPPGATHTPPAAGSRGLHALLHRVDPAGEPDGDGQADVAHELLRINPGTVEHAGVVVHFEGCEEPVLMTHEVVVQFVPDATEAEIAAVLAKHGLVEGKRSAFVRTRLLVETPPESDDDALEACEKLAAEGRVDFCEPNFVHAVEYLGDGGSDGALDDPLLPRQWHHDNDGTDGTIDADIDSVKAWRISTGSPEVVIAVLEDGFDVGHPDLVPNLWSSPEDPDVHGWDFEEDDASLLGDPDDPGATSHGTAVAGCAGARGGNGIGVTGSCPECRLMLLRRRSPTDYFHDAEAVEWAWHHGADVITNSWTYSERSHVPEVLKRAVAAALTEGRGGLGTVVLFATRNEDIDVAAIDDVASIEGVLCVGAVTNTDERTRACGSGPCLDVLGPSRLSSAPNRTEGTRDVVTTDWRGAGSGYNHDAAVLPEKDVGWDPCPDLGGDGDYTACFGGTSAATPIVAGVVGLVLSVAPELRREEVHRLLRDTADRVQDEQAAYDPRTGKSSNDSRGHGRVNAFEAVRVVAPTALGGRGGVDVFVRDHRLDWGNTEQPSSLRFEPERGTIGPWQSPDVRVDAPPLASPPATSAELDALPPEEALPGATNRVSVRVRNRGPRASGPIAATVLWTESSLVLPPLPEGFWAGPAPGAAVAADGPPGTWRSLGSRSIASVPPGSAACLADGDAVAAPIVGFDFDAPASPGGAVDPPHYAFLVLLHGADDPAGGDAAGSLDVLELVGLDNNATLEHVPVATASEPILVTLRNTADHAVSARLEVEASAAGASVHFEEVPDESVPVEAGFGAAGAGGAPPAVPFAVVGSFPMEAGEVLTLRVRLKGPAGTVELRLFADDALVGGATLVLR